MAKEWREDITDGGMALKLQSRSVVLVCTAWLCAAPAFSADSNSQTVEAYKLKQSHYTLGALETFYTNDAVKMVLKRNGTVLLAKAPSWKVMMFRPNGRVAHEYTQKEFLQTGMRWVQVPNIQIDDFKMESQEKVHGERVVEYSGSAPKDRHYHYWVIEPVKIPMDGLKVVDRAMRLPLRQAIGLKFIGTEPGHDELTSRQSKVAWSLSVNPRKPGGRSEMWRLFTSDWSKVKLPKSDFDYPVGYKMVLTEPEVLMTTSSQEVFEDLFGEVAPKKTSGH